jgi:surfeit locus 1 family protein
MRETASVTRAWTGWLLPGAITAIGLAVLVGLGLWQLERREWKQALIEALAERVAAPPTALPPPQAWSSLTQEGDEFRRVTFEAEFLHDREAFIFTGRSPLRPDVTARGYWVVTPARLPGGATVMVNRGFVPEARQQAASRPDGQVGGPVRLTGALRWPEARTWFTPADDPARNLWFIRDPAAIAAAKGVAPVAPFYIDLDSPQPPGGLPQAGVLRPDLPNNHLQYALTWFGLALALLAIFLIWAVRRPH